MTALVPREVERNVSKARGFPAGLQGQSTHEPGGQDFGNFDEALGSWMLCHHVRD